MPLTDKKRITNDRYLSKFATKSIRIPKEIEEDLNTAAAHAGESVAGYIVNATRENLVRELKLHKKPCAEKVGGILL